MVTLSKLAGQLGPLGWLPSEEIKTPEIHDPGARWGTVASTLVCAAVPTGHEMSQPGPLALGCPEAPGQNQATKEGFLGVWMPGWGAWEQASEAHGHWPLRTDGGLLVLEGLRGIPGN